ncbi:MAG: hypothetical protein ACRD9R_06165 [Pyrinomonadaceae bacterium]
MNITTALHDVHHSSFIIHHFLAPASILLWRNAVLYCAVIQQPSAFSNQLSTISGQQPVTG